MGNVYWHDNDDGTCTIGLDAYDLINGSNPTAGIITIDGKQLSQDGEYKKYNISDDGRSITLYKSNSSNVSQSPGKQYIPQVIDVRHWGARQDSYKECKSNGTLLNNGREDFHVFADDQWHQVPGMSGGFRYNFYNEKYEVEHGGEVCDPVGRCYKLNNTYKNINPGNDETYQEVLYDYDNHDDYNSDLDEHYITFRVGWITLVGATPTYESTFDVFAVRVRYTTDGMGNRWSTWQEWYLNSSTSWDTGPNWVDVNGMDLPDDCVTNITVEVQVANSYGIGVGTNKVPLTNCAEKFYRWNSSGNRTETYVYHPTRRIFVKPELTNTEIINKKRYLDWAKAEIQGPGNKYKHPLSKVIVYAKKSDDYTDDWKLVYRFNATSKSSNNPEEQFNAHSNIVMNLANQKKDTNAINNTNKAYSNNNTITKMIFEPGTKYDIMVYYTILLHDAVAYTNNAQTVTKSIKFTITTLPLSKIFVDREVSGVTTKYEYIFGKSQIGNSAKDPNDTYEPMQFRAKRQINDVEKLISDPDITWNDAYDQMMPMRITLIAKKGDTTVEIYRIYQRSNRAGDTETAKELSFTKSYDYSWRGFYPAMHLSLEEWDKLYKVFENNKGSKPNELQAEVQIDTKGSYDNWYENTEGIKKLTIKLTGIEPTSHINPNTSSAQAKRAYAWVNPNDGSGKLKRAVMWINDEPAGTQRDAQQRCI